jgi:hypothetical protein
MEILITKSFTAPCKNFKSEAAKKQEINDDLPLLVLVAKLLLVLSWIESEILIRYLRSTL